MALNVKEKVGSILKPSVEPAPIWPDAPRYAPTKQFPSYRYVEGVNPHPYKNAEGHSYGIENTVPMPLTFDNWQHHEDYFWGIDLYHQGFLWESCITWEGLLELCERDSYEANFLQGLILNSAAILKSYTGDMVATLGKSQAARWRMARIRQSGYAGAQDLFMGMNIPLLIEEFIQFYGPFWAESNRSAPFTKNAPRLRVKYD
jgi:hypothetical protein